jgi:hypothetical protein
VAGATQYSDWISVEDATTVHGFLVGGESTARIFREWVNEPCEHQPCPYGLTRLMLLDSARNAERAYRARNPIDREILRLSELFVYEIRLDDVVVAAPRPDRAARFLHELCFGPDNGGAWHAFRAMKDELAVSVLLFRAANGVSPTLLLRSAIPAVRVRRARRVPSTRFNASFRGV